MGDLLYKDQEKPDLGHPDAALRLASVVHRFRVPRSPRSVSFEKSFATVGKHAKTRRVMKDADSARKLLQEATATGKLLSSSRIVADAKRYEPLIHTILISCKVQPENARLDQKLIFEWVSGVEEKSTTYSSEAIMFDKIMTIATEGLGYAVKATENSMAGEFASAARDYACAAGVFEYMATDQLPKWIARGTKVDESDLPSECHAPFCTALKNLFMANGQQMAVATVLMKPGVPNYGLLGKLCFGIAEQLEDFVAALRRDAFKQLERMDKDFFSLLTFQVNLQKSLSLYFQARARWEAQEYGIAIALLSEATVALRTRETAASDGLPDVSKTPVLVPLGKEVTDLRVHMKKLLLQWEKDNSSVFYESVPQRVPESKKLQEGIQMNRLTQYSAESVEPVLLILPEGALERSDSDLARELQEKLNAGEDF